MTGAGLIGIGNRPDRPGGGSASRLIAALLAAVLVSSVALPARAGWWDTAGGAKAATLEEVRATPDTWRDVPVVLRVRFDALVEGVNPFFTQFTAKEWQPIAVLPRGDKSPASPVPRIGETTQAARFSKVFVRRGGADDLRLARLRRGQPLLVRAVVRDTTGGDPWLEVLSITAGGDDPTPEESATIQQAEHFLSRDNPGAAAVLLKQVLGGRELSTELEQQVRGRLGIALYEMRRHDEAFPHLAAGLLAEPTNRELRRRAAAVEDHLARVKSGERDPLSARDLPETARPARPAPVTPPRDPSLDDEPAPLSLPGARPRLAGPAGLAAPVTPTGAPPQPATAGDAPTRPAVRLPPARKPLAPQKGLPPARIPVQPSVAPAVPPTVRRPPPPKPPVILPPVKTGDESEDDEEETPPAPVPKRPQLSGPR